MKHTIIIFLLAITTTANAQFIDVKAGLSSWLRPAAVVDAGVNIQGFQVAANYTWQGFHSVGGTVGYMPYNFGIYAGAAKIYKSKSKEEWKTPPIIGGICWKDPQGNGTLDLRYSTGTIIFSMGVRLQ